MLSSSSRLKRVFTNRLVLFLTAVFLVFLFINLSGAWLKDRSIQQEIKALEQERTRLEQTKLHLLESLREIKTEAFAEKAARENFTLQKPGEQLVILIDDNKKIVEQNRARQAQLENKELSNQAKWWNYFFAPRQITKL